MSDIRTRPASKEYRQNFDRIFGKKKPKAKAAHKVTVPCMLCGAAIGEPCTHECIEANA